jgi:hypothetical protein
MRAKHGLKPSQVAEDRFKPLHLMRMPAESSRLAAHFVSWDNNAWRVWELGWNYGICAVLLLSLRKPHSGGREQAAYEQSSLSRQIWIKVGRANSCLTKVSRTGYRHP